MRMGRGELTGPTPARLSPGLPDPLPRSAESHVRRPSRIAVFLFGGLLLLVGLGILGLYLASQHVPAAYRRALDADPNELVRASNETVRKALALSGAAKHDKWHVRFTADEINGWLAVDMPKNHPDLLPADFSEPRVAITPQKMTLFCRYRRGKTTSALSLAVDVYVAEPDVLALRIRRARAGALPLPLGEVLDRISREARRRQFRLQWKQKQGDPVALVPLELRCDKDDRVLRVEAVELRQDEVYVSGTTE